MTGERAFSAVKRTSEAAALTETTNWTVSESLRMRGAPSASRSFGGH